MEDNRKITPRDYLELALRPVQGGGRDVSAKNEVIFFLNQEPLLKRHFILQYAFLGLKYYSSNPLKNYFYYSLYMC